MKRLTSAFLSACPSWTHSRAGAATVFQAFSDNDFRGSINTTKLFSEPCQDPAWSGSFFSIVYASAQIVFITSTAALTSENKYREIKQPPAASGRRKTWGFQWCFLGICRVEPDEKDAKVYELKAKQAQMPTFGDSHLTRSVVRSVFILDSVTQIKMFSIKSILPFLEDT